MASNTWIAYREGRASQDDWNTSKTYLVNYLDYDVGRVIWASYKDYGIDPQFFKEVDAALAQSTSKRVFRAMLEGIQKVGRDRAIADAKLQPDDTGTTGTTSAPH